MNDDNGPRNGNDENEWIFAHEADLMAQRPMLLDEVSRLRQHESSLVQSQYRVPASKQLRADFRSSDQPA
jgi:hypothetical protein